MEAAGSFAELAVRSGVPRLVLLSGRGEPEAERAERAVRATGAELTILRTTSRATTHSRRPTRPTLAPKLSGGAM